MKLTTVIGLTKNKIIKTNILSVCIIFKIKNDVIFCFVQILSERSGRSQTQTMDQIIKTQNCVLEYYSKSAKLYICENLKYLIECLIVFH